MCFCRLLWPKKKEKEPRVNKCLQKFVPCEKVKWQIFEKNVKQRIFAILTLYGFVVKIEQAFSANHKIQFGLCWSFIR